MKLSSGCILVLGVEEEWTRPAFPSPGAMATGVGFSSRTAASSTYPRTGERKPSALRTRLFILNGKRKHWGRCSSCGSIVDKDLGWGVRALFDGIHLDTRYYCRIEHLPAEYQQRAIKRASH